jgi:hypothetical protein
MGWVLRGGAIRFSVSPKVEAETKRPREGLKPPLEGLHRFKHQKRYVVAAAAILGAAFQRFSQFVS